MAQGLGLPRRRLCPPAQVLDLSHNELSFVPPDLPEALEELHLQGNRISHVGPEAFISTPRLRALFLRYPVGGQARQVQVERGGLWAVVAPERAQVGPSLRTQAHTCLSIQGQQASHDQHLARGLPGPPASAHGGHNG